MKLVFPALLLVSACASTPVVEHEDVRSVQVMVLGTYHFANPGQDVVNIDADDVLMPSRQAELDDLASRLLAFQPTAIAVEKQRQTDSGVDSAFAEFSPGDLSEDRNEIVQIGYRLAYMAGINRVYAVDEHQGEIEYFPFERVQALAARTGQDETLAGMIEDIRADAAELMRDQTTTSVTNLLARQNDPATIQQLHSDFYYGLLSLSEAEDHAGAVLNYGWYARNAEIFSNITEFAEPGDRILVIYGAGHNYWLRHFASQTPGFELIEPGPYLANQATANGS
jgi:Family of unknown function (DUF5694)